jgi:4'-phosphopantetheinyl transferase EntD
VGELLLPSLFAADIATEEVDLARDVIGTLSPEEAASIPQARHGRLLEFTAGRHCARAALSRLGVAGASVLRGEDRAPIWPSGFVGSITHTRVREGGWCGAAVASSTRLRSIGLDAEHDSPLESKLWGRVLSATERSWLESQPEAARGYLAKLVFSAKEAVYKCQYPLSHQFLEFAEVELPEPPTAETFSAILQCDAPPFRAGHTFNGRHVRRFGLIATAVVLE